eukprot:CAMPEP_0117446588 /NCGR_PEP_ID=MMETSP0759-20121206/6423_1 /TAXON_ID=63605 /ORGANISM="Percolomonas cosmopolitus, Strain WS" /LENGTH=132 /DNA_ID=CAMNT_0005238869 /DNA_START=170 /DNA_END=568 /DNA_ORIENTATION=+
MVEWFPPKPKAPFVPLHPIYNRVAKHFNETFPRTFRPYKLIRELNPNNTYMRQCFLVTGRLSRMSPYHFFGHICAGLGVGIMSFAAYRFFLSPIYTYGIQPYYNASLAFVIDTWHQPEERYHGFADMQQVEV